MKFDLGDILPLKWRATIYQAGWDRDVFAVSPEFDERWEAESWADDRREVHAKEMNRSEWDLFSETEIEWRIDTDWRVL